MLFQSRQTSGLFDPRQTSVLWPEPNDDPNIPYNWGLNGYECGSEASSKNLFARPNNEAQKVAQSKQNDVYRHVAFTVVAGAYGAYDSYSDNESNTEMLKSGLLYGAGGFAISYIVGKLL